MAGDLLRYKGSCHCGIVKFEVWAPQTITVMDCNCSICVKKQNKHFIVPLSQFKLMSGHDALTTYTFNTQKAKHTFCSTCGVQAFYIPRSNPNGYGIAPHCLDPPPTKVKVEKFDGQNWDESFKKHPNIARRSKEK